jgi:TolB protein
VAPLAARPTPADNDSGAPLPPADLPRHELIFAHHANERRDDYDIWRMAGDGTQLASLVVEPGHQATLTVSPEGDRFAYASRRAGAAEDIWVRSFGSRSAENVTDSPANDTQPAWGPGNRLAFFSDRDNEALELYLLDLTDRTLTRLTDNAFYEGGACWSPDGATIVFSRYFPADAEGGTEGHGELVALDLATTKETVLTDLGGYNGSPCFSPDGRRIAFHGSSTGRTELWMMNAAGGDLRQLTDTLIDEYSPAWSPDGEWIAFCAGVGTDVAGTFDLWIMRPDGSERQVLNRAANTQMEPHWRGGEHFRH